ncbi:CvpA family protein [Legionella sp. km772]|uniref:CvpA family protein n=1 Tax=Legionella sp. km772 TaxID=2498111 RepID=UPI000F8F21E9|nr:CvpA family protein [Legionella sp. km772]RUR07310.1 CvpA family protein [Legionella sp. km772]
MIMDLNWVDVGFILFFLLSMLAGFIRGFIRGVVSLLFLVLATYLAIKYAPPLAAHFASSTGQDQTISSLSLVFIFLLIFVFIILIGAIISYFLNMAFQLSGLGFINSFFGGLFGLVRAFIVSIFIIYVVQLTAVSNKLWQESQFVRYCQPMTAWLEKNFSPSLEALKTKISKLSNTDSKK